MDKELEKKLLEVSTAVKAEMQRRQLGCDGLASYLGYIGKSQLNELANYKGEANNKRTNGKVKLSITAAMVNRLHSDLCQPQTPIETLVYKDAQEIAKEARDSGDLFCMVGATGVGKTFAIEQLVRATANVWYVRCGHLDKPADVWTNLYNTMYGNKATHPEREGARAKRVRLLSAIAERAGDTANGLIVVDDMHHSNSPEFSKDLFWLYEQLRGLTGILMVGTGSLREQMERWAGIGKGGKETRKRPMMDEFYSRVKRNGIRSLGRTDKECVATVCRARGIQNTEVVTYLACGNRAVQKNGSEIKLYSGAEKLDVSLDLDMRDLTRKIDIAIESKDGDPSLVDLKTIYTLNK